MISAFSANRFHFLENKYSDLLLYSISVNYPKNRYFTLGAIRQTSSSPNTRTIFQNDCGFINMGIQGKVSPTDVPYLRRHAAETHRNHTFINFFIFRKIFILLSIIYQPGSDSLCGCKIYQNMFYASFILIWIKPVNYVKLIFE